MLESLIKKGHKKVAFSFYGILGIIVMIVPFVVIGFGIYFLVSKVNDYGIFWIVIGALLLIFSFRRLKDLLELYKYIFKPKNFPMYKALIEDGIDPSLYDQELLEADVLNKLNADNPLLMTEHFIIGLTQASFFILEKASIIWAYEYNGNGIVFYDKHKLYGFTFFKTVDGNDHVMDELKETMPYIYLGLEFDYKTIMHDEFDETVQRINSERQEFMLDPVGYKFKKSEEERIRKEEEQKRIEEEKNAQIEKIEENSVDFTIVDEPKSEDDVFEEENDN